MVGDSGPYAQGAPGSAAVLVGRENRQITGAVGRLGDTYTVTLTVTDSNGLQSTTSHQIAISAAGLGRVKISGNTAAVTLTCKGTSACSVTLQLSVTETSKGRKVIAVTAAKRPTKTTKKIVVVGKVSVSLSGGQTKAVHISLIQAGRQLLAKFHKLKVTLAVVSAGRAVSHTTVSFKTKK